MVFTLHRYVFRELFKVFVLTTIALTLMLNLVSIIGPIYKYGVGPNHIFHLLGYFLPITLTFVLPIAALFSSSLVYGRLAADNELNACRASGISYLTLIYPGVILAVAVSIANLLLSFYVVPAFVHRAEKSFKADAKQIIFRNIQRSGYYSSPDKKYCIYADYVDMEKDLLCGVVVTEVRKSEIERIVTAESATVEFNSRKAMNEVRITAYKTYQVNLRDNMSFSADVLPIRKEFPSMLGDNVKFKKIDEIKEIKQDPLNFRPIAQIKQAAYGQLGAELLADEMNARFRGDANNFYALSNGRKKIEFTAGKCEVSGDRKVRLSGDIVIVESDLIAAGGQKTSKPYRTLKSKRALIFFENEQPDSTVAIDIVNPQWENSSGKTDFAQHILVRGLDFPESLSQKLSSDNPLKTIKEAVEGSVLGGGPSLVLKNFAAVINRKIKSTFAEITAEIQSRLAFGVGCLPMLLIGIGLAILKKGGHMLSAFGISAIPAAVLVVCIMMGKNIIKNPGVQSSTGIILIWSGFFVLLFLTAIIYRKLLRN